MGKARSLPSGTIGYGDLIDGMDREQVDQQGVKILMELFHCHVVLLNEFMADRLNGSKSVDPPPEGRSRLIQDVDAVGFGEVPPDGDENAFAGHVTLHIIRILCVHGAEIHQAAG